MPLTIACTTEEQVPVTASPVTSGGRPAQIDGPLRITVQSGSGTFSQDPAFPLVFKAISPDVADETVYGVAADADLGAGEVLISDTVTANFSSAAAATFGLAAGPAEPKPAAARTRSARR